MSIDTDKFPKSYCWYLSIFIIHKFPNFKICQHRQIAKFRISKFVEIDQSQNSWISRFVEIDKSQNSVFRDLSKSTNLKILNLEICRNREIPKIRTLRFMEIDKYKNSDCWDVSKSKYIKDLNFWIYTLCFPTNQGFQTNTKCQHEMFTHRKS